MKIVQTNKAYYPKVGGIETTITNLSEGLANSYNLHVEVLACNHKITLNQKEFERNNVRINLLPTLGFITSLPISPSYFNTVSELSGDILHIHEPFPWADLSVLFMPQIRKKFDKIVVSWHSDIIRQKWVLSFYKKYIIRFLQVVDKIIVSNSRLIDNSDFLPEFKGKCEVIPIGTNLDWVDQTAPSNFIDDINVDNNILILFIGRLVYYKGIEYLIESMKDIEDTFLLIVGSGPLYKKLKRKIEFLKLSKRVLIIPEVDEKTLHSFYKKCDIFVLPSVEKSETYGIVQIEAMACGKPLICTELNTGTSFINQDNVTGLVVPPRDIKSLANAIRNLKNDPALRLDLGNKGKERAFKEFTAEMMVKRTYNLYKDLLNV